MKKLVLILITVGIVLLSGCDPLKEPVIERKPGRLKVVATSVSICQILDRIGYEDVVGVPETAAELPFQYAHLPVVGSPMTPDYERIKSLSPDLVLSPKSLERALSGDYTAAGISSAFLDLSSVGGMYKAIKSLGELLGCEEESLKLTEEYEQYMMQYRAKTGARPDILLLMAFPDGFYLVATENSYVGNLLELAGAKNVYDKNYSGDENVFVSINPEDIVQKKPDIILVFAHYNEKAAFTYMEKEFKTNPMWRYFEAVKKERIHYLPSSKFGTSATMLWTEALDYLMPVLYQELAQ